MAQVATPAQSRRFGCLSSPHGSLTLMIPEGIPFTMVNSSQIASSGKLPSTLVHPIKVKLPAPHFITFRPRNTEITMHQIIPFYVQKALDVCIRGGP
jgi:hypothetical protein